MRNVWKNTKLNFLKKLFYLKCCFSGDQYMQKIMLIIFSTIIFVFVANVNIGSKFDNEISKYEQEARSIINKYNGKNSEAKLYEELEKCSQRGNHVCSFHVSLYHYQNDSYDKAYPFLLKLSENKHYNGHVNYMLGEMFSEGLGVLQSFDKAIYYYEKSARTGNSQAALSISAEFEHRAKLSNKRDKQNEFLIKSYAWYKIHLALDPNSARVDGCRSILKNARAALASRSLLNDGDNLATKICSEIPQCVQ